jgi:hypothetical protein
VTGLLTPGAIDGKGARTERHSLLGRKGDLTVELHYGDFDTGHGRQAALYIWRRGHEDRGVYVPLSLMWQMGYTVKEQAHAMMNIVPSLAEHLYGFVTRDDATRVMDAIIDYLDDLQKSPPDPALFRDRSLDAFLESCEREGLEFSAKINGKTVIH